MTGARPERPAAGWLIACGCLVGAGLLLIAADRQFRWGAMLIGAGLLLAGWLRAFLSPEQCGLLAIRSRRVDLTVYLALGLGIAALALVVPA